MLDSEFQNLKQRSLFARLKKLFSTDVIVRNIGGKQLKVVDTDEAMYATDRNTLRDRFNRIRTSAFNQYSRDFSLSYQASRIELFRDYDTMDLDPILSSALDIFADECLSKNELGKILTIHSDNGNIKEILENLFYDILNIEFNLWSWTRNLVKYGDFYLKLHISPEYGIYLVEPLSAYNVTRVENSDLNNKSYVKFQVNLPEGGKIENLENYNVAHFRLLSDSNFLPYGKSQIENARRVWKQLCLHEDSKIWTSNGYKKIKNISVGDNVYSYDYKLNKLISTVVRNHKFTGNREVYCIKTSHRTINATAEHPILTKDGVYKNVQDLTTNDYIVIGNTIIDETGELPNLFLSNDILVSNFKSEYYENELSNKSVKCLECGIEQGRITGNHIKTHGLTTSEYYKKHNIDENYSALFNRNSRIPYNSAVLYCKENDISTKNLNVFVEKCENSIVSEEVLKSNIQMLVRFFGFMLGDGWTEKNAVCFSLGDKLEKSMKYVELMNDLNVNYRIRNEHTSRADCVVSSTFLSLLLTNNLEFKTGTLNKILPNWVYKLPLNLKKELLYGFADADGTILENDRFSIGGINKELIESLHVLAQQCGFSTTNLREHVESRENRSNFYTFEFGNSTYHFKLDSNNVIIEKIKSITNIGNCNVYDIEVDNDLHNFISDGVIAHNCLMEDAMLIHRIMRAPEKRVFKVDIGNLPPQEIDAYIAKLTAQMQKVPYIDEKTGDYNLRFNLQNMVEDFFIPVRGSDTGTSIEPLSGMEFTGIDDIEYLRNKMMAALKIPKAFLSYEEDLSGKATLAQEDVRFAKTILRVQRILVSELTKIAVVHLYSQGFKDAALVNFSLELANPSVVFEKEKISMWAEKVAVAKDMMEQKLFSKEWIYNNIFHLSEQDVKTVSDSVVEDSKQIYRFKQIEEEGNDPAKPFEKIKPPGQEPAAGGGEPGASEPNEPAGGETVPPPPALTEKTKEPYVRPSQAGKKKSSDYPFGEDKIGKLSFSTRNDTDSIRHSYKNKSPLNFEGLGAFLSNLEDDKKALLSENQNKGSYMDENGLSM